MSADAQAARRILLFGAGGQLGRRLAERLAPRDQVRGLRHGDCDIGDSAAVRAAIAAYRPEIIVNAAAYTAVDRAEDEPDQAYAANAVAPGVMAEEARAIGAVLVHYSTDYVFDGRASRPYRETDPTAPLGVYGASKREGEERVMAAGGCTYILRTAWLYARTGRNFLTTIERLARERTGLADRPLTIVADQTGSPTSVGALAAATEGILRHAGLRDLGGLYHATCGGETTWYGFAQAIVAGLQIAADVRPITTADYPTRARRPAYSVLSGAHLQELFDIRMPSWQDALAGCLQRES